MEIIFPVSQLQFNFNELYLCLKHATLCYTFREEHIHIFLFNTLFLVF
jgi:hypothetical protein